MKRAILLTSVIILLLFASQALAMNNPSSMTRYSEAAGQLDRANPPDNTNSGNMVSRGVPTANNNSGNVTNNSSINGKQYGLDDPISDQDPNHGSEIIVPPGTVPEPTTLILIGLGLAGAGLLRRKK